MTLLSKLNYRVSPVERKTIDQLVKEMLQGIIRGNNFGQEKKNKIEQDFVQ